MSTGYKLSDDPNYYNDISQDLVSKLPNIKFVSIIDRAARINRERQNTREPEMRK